MEAYSFKKLLKFCNLTSKKYFGCWNRFVAFDNAVPIQQIYDEFLKQMVHYNVVHFSETIVFLVDPYFKYTVLNDTSLLTITEKYKNYLVIPVFECQVTIWM